MSHAYVPQVPGRAWRLHVTAGADFQGLAQPRRRQVPLGTGRKVESAGGHLLGGPFGVGATISPVTWTNKVRVGLGVLWVATVAWLVVSWL